jgi:hypothetical protein
MDKEIRARLIQLARSKTTLAFSQLNEQLQLGLNFRYASDRKLLGEWLDEVSQHEFDKKRPLLSSLIIHRGTEREQGIGFYKLCEILYEKSWKKYKTNKSLVLEIMNECYSFWGDEENYRKYKTDH